MFRKCSLLAKNDQPSVQFEADEANLCDLSVFKQKSGLIFIMIFVWSILYFQNDMIFFALLQKNNILWCLYHSSRSC